jgi:hypothetical protein
MAVVADVPQPQRAAPRHAIDAEVTLSGSVGPLAHGRTRNLSTGGLCAVMSAPIARGTTVEVAIALVFEESGLSEPLTLPARVVWCTAVVEGEQVGLAFLPLRPDQAAYLEMFIRFLADDPQAS